MFCVNGSLLYEKTVHITLILFTFGFKIHFGQSVYRSTLLNTSVNDHQDVLKCFCDIVTILGSGLC